MLLDKANRMFPEGNGKPKAVAKVGALLACIAPRPVYVHSGADDTWADALGEYLGAHHASPVYELLGERVAEGVRAGVPPPLGEPVMDGAIGYHCREGGHSTEDYDWQCFLDFADAHLKRGYGKEKGE